MYNTPQHPFEIYWSPPVIHLGDPNCSFCKKPLGEQNYYVTNVGTITADDLINGKIQKGVFCSHDCVEFFIVRNL